MLAHMLTKPILFGDRASYHGCRMHDDEELAVNLFSLRGGRAFIWALLECCFRDLQRI